MNFSDSKQNKPRSQRLISNGQGVSQLFWQMQRNHLYNSDRNKISAKNIFLISPITLKIALLKKYLSEKYNTTPYFWHATKAPIPQKSLTVLINSDCLEEKGVLV